MSEDSSMISFENDFGSQAKVGLKTSVNARHVDSVGNVDNSVRASDVVAGIPGQHLDVPGTVAGVPGQSHMSTSVSNTFSPVNISQSYASVANSSVNKNASHTPTEIKKRTVKATLSKGQFYREDILKALRPVCKLSLIESLYTIGRNNEWYITFFSKV